MKHMNESLKRTFVRNFIGGIATGLGLTVGLSIVAYLLSMSLTTFGGLPVIGTWIATIVDATLIALKSK